MNCGVDWKKRTERMEQMNALGHDLGPQEQEEPEILDEIDVEDLTVDGICGVY